MCYEGESGELSSVSRLAGDVPALGMGVSAVRFVAPGSLTAGRYGLFHWDMPPQAGGASPHFHRTFSESFYVLSGTVQLGDGDDWVDAGPGDFLYVPEGGIHAFRNVEDEPASMLILFAPGAPREHFFEELAEIRRSGRQLTPGEWTDLYARHDQYMV